MGSGPTAARAAQLDDGSRAVGERGGRAQDRAAPDGLALDLRVEVEHRRRLARARGGARVPEVHRVAELVAREAQLQTDRARADRALHGMSALAHGAADRLRARPQHRRQPALLRERGHGTAARGLGEQAQRAVEARLARAVRPRDHVQSRQRDDQAAQGAVVLDGEGADHPSSVADGSDNPGRPSRSSCLRRRVAASRVTTIPASAQADRTSSGPVTALPLK